MSVLSASFVLSSIFFLFTTTHAAIGELMCRYTATTPSAVNYYFCTDFANYYGISLDKFFQLNPSVNRECDNIAPHTEYCVAGFFRAPISTDGFCGPQHGNASCVGTDKQCCNSATWKCGDTIEDCAAGTCYEGGCESDPALYSLDGKCGPSTGNKICAGKWGECCNYNGICGSSSDFCSIGNCQSGACQQPPMPEPTEPSPFGTTPDGSCGGSEGYTCGVIYGNCCNKNNKCGSTLLDCGTGCQRQFGTCSASGISPDGSCGGADGYNCENSAFGNCCSSSFFCGSTNGHCGAGCKGDYGLCTPGVSQDGTCGGSKGWQCLGSGFGDCCSSSGYCGSSEGHCENGCQTSFGMCTAGGVPVRVWDPITGSYIIPTPPKPI